MLAGLCRLQRMLSMQGVGGGDEHGIDARVAQERPEITVGRLGAMLCSAGLRPVLIAAADRHQLGIGSGVDGRCDFMVDVQSSADDGPPQCHGTPHTFAPALQSKNRASQLRVT